ncbi:hypothetical protein QJS04_geneDACA021397 [Acorus gramineus]|uniref:Uncharacterized protein n=1 Tax=Acorus gramineus TaxID=55184 RepID=A0AAV9A5M2_ACOGR|nr:hypothetical protein QJS04_geneDACA021397 [Acorus gramineus]
MSLLEIITRATLDTNRAAISFSPILNADDILPSLKPRNEVTAAANPPIRRVEGWAISETDAKLIESSDAFLKKLIRKLRNPKSLDRDEFLRLLTKHLGKLSTQIGVSVEPAPSSEDVDFARAAVEKLGLVIGRDVAGPVSEACALLGIWDLLETLILQKLVVGGPSSSSLVERLIEKGRSDLLCLCIKHVTNIRSADLVSIMKHFLSLPSADHSMVSVKKEWEKQTFLAIKKATKEGKPSKAAANAAVLLMMAHDGFSPSETCLHFVFSSPDIDGLVLSSAVSMLSGVEVSRLVKYFVKWLKKYERFPFVIGLGKPVSGLEDVVYVPSLGAVVKGLGLVFDEHFSYFVMNSGFHEEMREINVVVRALAREAKLCSPLGVLIENLRSGESGTCGGL